MCSLFSSAVSPGQVLPRHGAHSEPRGGAPPKWHLLPALGGCCSEVVPTVSPGVGAAAAAWWENRPPSVLVVTDALPTLALSGEAAENLLVLPVPRTKHNLWEGSSCFIINS